jgi:hypothetical protein
MLERPFCTAVSQAAQRSANCPSKLARLASMAGFVPIRDEIKARFSVTVAER